MRARELGIVIGGGKPGKDNAITDVPGVRVGHTTLIQGDGPLIVGQGPVRTGVTVIVPDDDVGRRPMFAGCHRLNGNGELTGLEWIRDSGMLSSAIAITNTHSVGIVRDALIADEIRARPARDPHWSLPVVGETWDGRLNDINGMHVRAEHVSSALSGVRGGPVPEGNVGGGTGMICHGFKGGIGTSSRVTEAAGGFTVGVLVQANYGRRERFRVNGLAVGEVITSSVIPEPDDEPTSADAGSIIIVVATNAPLLPNQCARLAQRAGLGVARTGGVGENSSGDLFLAFSTANRLEIHDRDQGPVTGALTSLSNSYINHLFDAVIEATEEAILNALLAADTMTGRDGITAHRLQPDVLLDALERLGGTRGQRRS